MLFNSFEFVAFLAVVLALFSVTPLRARGPVLLACSYLFYGWWDWRFLSLIVLSTAVDWACGLALARRRQRRWVALSVVVNLGILATFKYLGFFSRELGVLLEALGVQANLPMLDVVLPVGLSFYTFQSMAYTIDVYRSDTEATTSPLKFALFVAFFPQLVAGPIERHRDLQPQLDDLKGSTAKQRAEAVHLIVWGLFKKVFVADNLSVLVGLVYEARGTPSGFLVLVAAYAFTWQIYCDFSGYTDMARGVAKLLGVELSINFRLPFFADGPQDLWRRWHISLSRWLRDYLYIPLGGSRRGPVRTQVNLALTMVLGGLWHGANWTFIVWGAYHGLALAVQRALGFRARGRLAKAAAIVATFHFTCLGFMVFRAHSLKHMGALVGAFAGGLTPGHGEVAALKMLAAFIAVPLLVEIVQYYRGDDLGLLMRLPWPVQGAIIGALGVATALLGGTYGQQFIYFQF